MAVDTRDKRMAVLALRLPPFLRSRARPQPAGGLTALGKRTLVGAYLFTPFTHTASRRPVTSTSARGPRTFTAGRGAVTFTEGGEP